VHQPGLGASSAPRPAPLSTDRVWNRYGLYRRRSFSLRVSEPTTRRRLTSLPGGRTRSPFLPTPFSSASPRQRYACPPPSPLRDHLGRNSRSPALGPSHSPTLSLGTKCKSVAVPASIKNFKNRTKQTEKDFHSNLKIHQSPKSQQTPDNLCVPRLLSLLRGTSPADPDPLSQPADDGRLLHALSSQGRTTAGKLRLEGSDRRDQLLTDPRPRGEPPRLQRRARRARPPQAETPRFPPQFGIAARGLLGLRLGTTSVASLPPHKNVKLPPCFTPLEVFASFPPMKCF